MARLDADYTGDLTDLEGGAYTTVAPGKYKAIITSADLEPTKDKTGVKLSLVVQIIEGEYKGVTIFDTVNIRNANPVAQKIGTERKARIGVILLGTPNPKDTESLLNKVLIIETTTEPYNDKIYNKIKQYHPVNGEFKDLVSGKKAATPNIGSTTPAINYPSTITNGAGGVMSYVDGREYNVPAPKAAQESDDSGIPF